MKITEHIHMLNIPFSIPIGPDRTLERSVNVFLIIGPRHSICVDSGVAGTHDAIVEYVAAHGRSPKDISLLILTHSHPDHIGAAAPLQRMTGCTVAAHPAEQAWIEDTALQARERPVPGFSALVSGPVVITHPLSVEQTLTLDSAIRIETINTPGHSPGSISLWVPDDGALITADAVPRPGTMPIYTDIAQSIISIKHLQQIEKVSVLLSSWDEPHRGTRIPEIFGEALAYLQEIHAAVRELSAAFPDQNALTAAVVSRLGLDPFAANPLVARSLQSHQPLLEKTTII